MIKVAIGVFLIAFLGLLPSLAVAGSADKLSYSKPPSQPRFFFPAAPASAPPLAVQPAPPADSQAPVQRREIVITERRHIIHEFRDRRRPVIFDGAAVSFFPSAGVAVAWSGWPYFYRPRSAFCREILATEERLKEVETAPGFSELHPVNTQTKRVVCERW